MSKKKNNKNKKMHKTDYKKDILILLIFFIAACIIISTIINSLNISAKKDNKGVETMELKDFIDVNLDEIIKMINAKNSFVLYVGYTGCQACEKYSPILKRVQSQNEVDTYYLNYKTIDKKSKNWKTLTSLIDIEQKITVSKDNENITIDDEIGNIMKKYGYTPVTVVFSNGKCINAHIGSMSSSEIEKFLVY